MKQIEDRLHPNEPWFTLRGKDTLAPHAVMVYAGLLRAAAAGYEVGERSIDDLIPQVTAAVRPGELREMAADAERIAAEMISWQAQHPELAHLPD